MTKRIFISVLNWGFGHATRMVPVIEEIQKLGGEIVLASAGNAKLFLEQRFPGIETLEMPDFPVHYNAAGAGYFLLKRGLTQQKLNKKQYEWTSTVLKKSGITHLISDNVYGTYSKKIPGALITHQVGLLTPVLKHAVNKRLASWLNCFTEVWVPDEEGENSIAGNMLLNPYYHKKSKFIGHISRFKKKNEASKEIDYLAILSGPEPQRSQFEKMVIEKFQSLPGKKIIVGGKLGNKPRQMSNNLAYHPFLHEDILEEFILKSKFIVCRSGYTTLLDLISLQSSALLIPTPQQPEQKYLANRMEEKNWFYKVSQKEFKDLDLKLLPVNSRLPFSGNDHRLKEVVGEFLGIS